MMGEIIETIQCGIRLLWGFGARTRRTWGVVVASNADGNDAGSTEPRQRVGDERPILIFGRGGIEEVTRLDEKVSAVLGGILHRSFEARP
jgi:hypothetical protein